MLSLKGEKGIIVVTLLLRFLSSAHAGSNSPSPALRVTRVKVEQTQEGKTGCTMAKVMLNECIVIKEIRLLKTDRGVMMQLPEYVSKRGVAYPQVKLLTDELRERVLKAIETGRAEENRELTLVYKVAGWHTLKGLGKRKVNVEIVFNNAISIVCGIIEGKNGPWVAWPSRRAETGEWVEQVYISDEKVRKAVENSVLNKYRSFLNEGEEW